jgi:hypothetical protein
MTTLQDRLEVLADQLLTEVSVSGDIKEKIDVFKSVSTWQISLVKVKKSDEDNPGEFNRLKDLVNGKGPMQ